MHAVNDEPEELAELSYLVADEQDVQARHADCSFNAHTAPEVPLIALPGVLVRYTSRAVEKDAEGRMLLDMDKSVDVDIVLSPMAAARLAAGLFSVLSEITGPTGNG